MILARTRVGDTVTEAAARLFRAAVRLRNRGRRDIRSCDRTDPAELAELLVGLDLGGVGGGGMPPPATLAGPAELS